jgi:tRNA threonylcarbamoyladenosine biosynthesis protein TsaE
MLMEISLPFEFIAVSEDETVACGIALAATLQKGSVVALRGGLGAGKTYFTKGLAKGLGVTEAVTSPTYTIINEYEGRLPFYHIDAYRLNGDSDFTDLGADELLYGNGVTVIEWSEKIPHSIPMSAVMVSIEILPDRKRKISIKEGGLVSKP